MLCEGTSQPKHNAHARTAQRAIETIRNKGIDPYDKTATSGKGFHTTISFLKSLKVFEIYYRGFFAESQGVLKGMYADSEQMPCKKRQKT